MKITFASPAERLIASADFNALDCKGSHAIEYVRDQVLALAGRLAGTGACIKINTALAYGYPLIEEIHDLGLRVFVDGKYYDVSQTLAGYGARLRPYKPDFVTVSCHAGVEGIRAFKEQLPDSMVLGVTVLTSFTEEQAISTFGRSVTEEVLRLANMIAEAGGDALLDGLISAPAEAGRLQQGFNGRLLIVTPNIRLEGQEIRGDDQNLDRSMTPRNAIKAGADMLVVGRPITQARKPAVVTQEIIEEIRLAA